MTTLQQIQAKPEIIFSTQNDVLRNELATQPIEETAIFLRTMANAEWLRTLDESMRFSLFTKVSCVIPAKAVIDKIEEIDLFSQIFMPFMPDKPPKDFFKQLYTENRSFCYAMHCRNRLLSEVNLQDHPSNILGLFHDVYLHFPDECIFLLEEEISLTAKIDGSDLLDMACNRDMNPSLFLKILQVYRRRLPADEYKALLQTRASKIFERLPGQGQKIVYLISAFKEIGLPFHLLDTDSAHVPNFPWANSPIEWMELFKCLSDQTKKHLLQKFPFYFIIQFGLSDDPSDLHELFLTLNAMHIGPQAYSLETKPGHLSYLEKFFLMLGRRGSAKQLYLSRQPGVKVTMSKTDSVYRTFDPQTAREQSTVSYTNLMAELQLHKNDPSIWTDQKFLKKAHAFMVNAFLETIFLFRDAWEKSGHDAQEMGRLLSDQSLGNSGYIKKYFYRSFVEFYLFSLGKVVFEENGNNLVFPKLSFKDEDPFFDPLQPQYHWRVMYSAIRSLLSFYPFDFDHFDGRYFGWTHWHLEREIEKDEVKPIPFYSTRPTL